MAAYATADDATDYIEGLVIDDPAAFDKLLERATRDVDNVLGALPPLTTGDYAGLKLDPAFLADWEAAALARATCAQAEHRLRRGPDLGEPARKSVKGPVFEVAYADGAGSGLIGAKVKLELATIRHLRRLTARAVV